MRARVHCYTKYMKKLFLYERIFVICIQNEQQLFYSQFGLTATLNQTLAWNFFELIQLKINYEFVNENI